MFAFALLIACFDANWPIRAPIWYLVFRISYRFTNIAGASFEVVGTLDIGIGSKFDSLPWMDGISDGISCENINGSTFASLAGIKDVDVSYCTILADSALSHLTGI